MRLKKYFLILIPYLVSFDCLSPGGKEADEGRLAGGRLDDAAAQATWAPGMRDFTFRCEACQLPYSFLIMSLNYSYPHFLVLTAWFFFLAVLPVLPQLLLFSQLHNIKIYSL